MSRSWLRPSSRAAPISMRWRRCCERRSPSSSHARSGPSGRDSVQSIPSHARVVIIGGGIVGCSVAYHLAKRGCTEVLLLERRKLTCGTTWHAAGLVGQLRATQNLTRLAQYTTQLYEGLERETGQATGFRQVGSVAVAASAPRLEELKPRASMAHFFGLEGGLLCSGEAPGPRPLRTTH